MTHWGVHLRVCLLYTPWFKGQKKKDKQGKPRRMASEKRKEGEKGDCWSMEIKWRNCFNCVICCPEAEKMNKWLSDLVMWPWQRFQWLNVSLIRSRFKKERGKDVETLGTDNSFQEFFCKGKQKNEVVVGGDMKSRRGFFLKVLFVH